MASGSLSELLTAVLVPVGFDQDRERVEFLDVQGADLGLPFFSDSLALVRDSSAHGPLRLNFEVDYASVVQAGRTARGPSGLLFHSGRCGSTLLSALMSAALSTAVVREPDVITSLLSASLRTTKRNSLTPVLDAMLRLLADRLPALIPGSQLAALVKLSAWNVTCAQWLLDLLPECQSVFLTRDPLESVASYLHHAPLWFDYLWHQDRRAQSIFFPALADTGEESFSPVTFFAHAWRSMVEDALRIPPSRMLFLEYRGMVDDPVCTIERVAAHLGLRQTAGREAIEQTARIYSKDPTRREVFSPATKHAVPRLQEEDAAKVHSITALTRDAACSRLGGRPPARQG